VKPTKKRGRAFLDLTPLDLAGDEPREHPLFLRRFDAPALRHEWEQAGLFDGLAARGYREVELRTEYSGGEHRLQALAKAEPEVLIDVRLAEESRLTQTLVPRPHNLDVLSVLAVHWLEMQDPRVDFTSDRPQLPGQRHPGLRLTRPLIVRIHAWAVAWGKDAVLNVPEYFHNAVFYSAAYQFVSPARQGRFLALRRDLASLSVAAASQAIDQGQVVEEPEGRRLRWESGEMIAPLTEPVRDYLESREWKGAAAAACEAARFRLR